jgi:hypothetical protein
VDRRNSVVPALGVASVCHRESVSDDSPKSASAGASARRDAIHDDRAEPRGSGGARRSRSRASARHSKP